MRTLVAEYQVALKVAQQPPKPTIDFGQAPAPVVEKKKTVPSKRIDLGAAANWSSPASAPVQQQQQQQHDLFSLDQAPPQPVQPAAPTQGGAGSFWGESASPSQPTQPAPQQFDAFADFSATPVSVQAPTQNVDLFGALSSPQQQQPTIDLMSPMNLAPSPTSQTMAPMGQATTSTINRNVGSTWAGSNSGGVNIDLTNLGKRQEQKKSMSMNELKQASTTPSQTMMSPTMGFGNQMGMMNPQAAQMNQMMGQMSMMSPQQQQQKKQQQQNLGNFL